MKTNHKFYENYILERITFDGYDDKFEALTDDNERLLALKKVIDGERLSIIDYLQGLGSCLRIAFSNHEILQLYKEAQGIETMTEKEEDKILENYFKFMANALRKMFNKAERAMNKQPKRKEDL